MRSLRTMLLLRWRVAGAGAMSIRMRHATVALPAGNHRWFGTITKIRTGKRQDGAIFGALAYSNAVVTCGLRQVTCVSYMCRRVVA